MEISTTNYYSGAQSITPHAQVSLELKPNIIMVTYSIQMFMLNDEIYVEWNNFSLQPEEVWLINNLFPAYYTSFRLHRIMVLVPQWSFFFSIKKYIFEMRNSFLFFHQMCIYYFIWEKKIPINFLLQLGTGNSNLVTETHTDIIEIITSLKE